MKKYLLSIILLSATPVMAYDGGLQETFSPQLDSRELENAVKYEYLKEEYDTKLIYSNGLTKCAQKNKYYMPGHGAADSDGCYDLIGYLNSLGLTGQEVTYTGTSINKSDGNFAPYSTQTAGDALCQNSNPNWRAMRSSDIKYIYRTGNIGNTIYSPVNLFSLRASSANIGFGDYVWNNNAGPSTNCNNFTSGSGTYGFQSLDTASGGLQYKTVNCNQNIRVVCVVD